MRLDVYLVEKKYFDTRHKSQIAIKTGKVKVNGKTTNKPSFEVSDTDIVEVESQDVVFVSQGAYKLQKAVDVFRLDFQNKIVLDVGASTGGFTQVALLNGAKLVFAVDVGSNQLHESLRNNPNVICFEQTDIRDLTPEHLNGINVDYVVADLSFISVRKVFEYLLKFLKPQGQIVVLIKPQFEVGAENIDKSGIVRNAKLHYKIVYEFVDLLRNHDFYIQGFTYAPVHKNKNIEYLCLIGRQCTENISFGQIIDEAFALQKSL